MGEMKNYKILILTVIFLLPYLFCNYVYAQSRDEIVAKFLKRSHTFESTTLPYRLFVPENYDTAVSYPLVLCLHGVGECGTDNEIQIKYNRLATSWADTINQHRWPCFVVAPQCPVGMKWANVDPDTRKCNIDKMPITNELLVVNHLLDVLIDEFNIDSNRLYITGLSMGGFGTWDMIARFPDKFAAAVPMSGGGDTSKVSVFKDVPVWNFHGALDNSVPVSFSREMFEAYEKIFIPVVKVFSLSDDSLNYQLNNGAKHLYTEYPNGYHVIWAESYDNPKLFPWVFSQIKSYTVNVKERKITSQNSYILNQNYPNPFNPTTKIKYSIPASLNPSKGGTLVQLKVYDILGREIETLVNEEKPAGVYEINWNAANLSSGVYFYQLKAGEYINTKKMVILK
jgi:predicted esterase